jgi:hypothetical protein
MGFKETKPESLTDNPFKLIGSDWMLITAGTPEAFNTMTASWGGLGILWERKVATCYIRPTRYTYEFAERAQYFTLSFFSEKHRKALTYCGTHSGRNSDKVNEAGLTPVKEGGFVYFEDEVKRKPALERWNQWLANPKQTPAQAYDMFTDSIGKVASAVTSQPREKLAAAKTQMDTEGHR